MMTPDEFNRIELDAGRINEEYVTELTKISQRVLGLTVDGRCGPITRNKILPLARPAAPQTIGEAVVAFAVTLIGQGEEGGNNRGSFLTRIGGQQGMEWCALSAGYAWRETLRRAGKTPASYWYRRLGVAEPGALNLARAISAASAAAGGPGRFSDPSQALPGDIATLDHGDGHGHSMLVEFNDDGLTHTLEGNVGKYPAKYRRLVRDLAKESRFWGFVRPPV